MKIFGREPVAIYAAIIAIINVVALGTGWDPSPDLLGGINAAIAAVLGVITRQAVTPVKAR